MDKVLLDAIAPQNVSERFAHVKSWVYCVTQGATIHRHALINNFVTYSITFCNFLI